MAKAGKIPDVRRRDWEDPMTVEWNKRHAHVPLHCHTNIEGERRGLRGLLHCDSWLGGEF